MENVKVYDPVASLAKLLDGFAGRIADWQLDIADEAHVGELKCAVEHAKLAAKHFLLANGRKV